jgi:hypothetical protein
MHRRLWIGVALFIAACSFRLLVPFGFGMGWRGRNLPFNFIAFWVLTILGLGVVLSDAVRTVISAR